MYNLFVNDLEKARKNCQFTMVSQASYAARITDSLVYFYSPNETVLHAKCTDRGQSTSEKLTSKGATLLHLGRGCTVNTNSYIFNRGKEMLTENIQPIMTSVMPPDFWTFLQNPTNKEKLNSFIRLEMKNKGTFRVQEFETSFGLKHLTHQNATIKNIFASATSIIIFSIFAIIMYTCRQNQTRLLTCKQPERGLPVVYNRKSQPTGTGTCETSEGESITWEENN